MVQLPAGSWHVLVLVVVDIMVVVDVVVLVNVVVVVDEVMMVDVVMLLDVVVMFAFSLACEDYEKFDNPFPACAFLWRSACVQVHSCSVS